MKEGSTAPFTSRAVQAGPHTRILNNYVSQQLTSRFASREDPSKLEPFEYEPLVEPRTVRLLVLQPALLFGSPLQCNLRTIELGSTPFEALSYVWGSTEDPQPLICQGKRLAITQNLDEALRFLRRKRRERLLWVDAVCINQADIPEKETQIAMMREIYTLAEHSLIWLGPADMATLSAFQVARIMHQPNVLVSKYQKFQANLGVSQPLDLYIDLSPRTVRRRRLKAMYGQDVLMNAQVGNSLSPAFRELFERAWFKRTWTLQELILNKSPIFICGRHTIAADRIASFVNTLPWFVYDPREQHQEHYRVQGQILMQILSKNISTWTQRDALLLMMVAQSAATTNPKDAVIGLQALLQQMNIQLPPLSYSMSVNAIYTAFTQCWLSHWGDLQLLNLSGANRVTPGLPTWAFDLNALEPDDELTSNHYTRLTYLQCMDSTTRRHISACRGHAIDREALADITTTNQLRLLGHQLTRVRCCAGPSGVVHRYVRPEETEEDIQKALVELQAKRVRTIVAWAMLLNGELKGHSVLEVADCFASILNVGPKTLLTRRYQEKEFSTELTKICNLSSHLIKDDTDLVAALEGDKLWLSPLWQALSLRIDTETLIVTEDGRICLSYSQPVAPGDLVVLTAGTDFPLLLRRVADSSTQYLLLGPTIVSSQPGQSNVSSQNWRDITDQSSQSRTESILAPRLPGSTESKGSFKNYFVTKSTEEANVSAVMRGYEWPEEGSEMLQEMILV